MLRYWKILWRVMKMSFERDLAYKWDFLMGNSGALAYIVVQLLMIAIMFDAGGVERIGGFSKYEIYFVLLISELVIFFQSIFVTNNILRVRDQIIKGELDELILKPINTWFYSMFQRVGLKDGLAIVCYAIVLLPYAYSKMDVVFSWLDWVQILLILILSIVLTGAMYWICIYVNFFIDKFLGLLWFMNNMIDIGHFPRNVYPLYLQWILLYIWPIFMIANPVYLVIGKQFGWFELTVMIAMTIIFVCLAKIIWDRGLNRYQSAG